MQQRWAFTVEKESSGAARALEAELLRRKDARFKAVVQPDLPAANTWQGLLQKGLQGSKAGGTRSTSTSTSTSGGKRREDLCGADVVQTVGVNLRTRRELGSYLHQKVTECRDRYGCDGEDGDDDEGTTRMRALLCVSGGHPARRLPFLGGRAGILADSADLLREASRCRDTLGSLALGRESLSPGDPFELWCVENPLQAFDGGRLARKLEAGATKVVTQPPLLRDAFLRWFEECDGALGGTLTGTTPDPFLVGVPCITSANSLSFWLEICGVRAQDSEEAMAALGDLRRRQDSMAPRDFDDFCLERTRELVELCKGLPHVSGLHFMPVTAKGYKQLLSLDL